MTDDEYIEYLLRKKHLKLSPEFRCKLANVCNICDKQKHLRVFNPCGHTACNTCSKKLQNVCHICRSDIESVLKLFL